MTTQALVKQSVAVLRARLHVDRAEQLGEVLRDRAEEDGVVRVTSLSLNLELEGWVSAIAIGIVAEGEPVRFRTFRCGLHAEDQGIGEELSRWAAQGIDLATLVTTQSQAHGFSYFAAAGSVCPE